MRKNLLVMAALSVLGVANAAGILFLKVPPTSTKFCQQYGCQRTKKILVNYESGPKIQTDFRLTKYDAALQVHNMPSGILTGGTLSFERFPLSVEDAEVALFFVKTWVGSTYTAQRLERCFEEAEKNRVSDYPNMGEALMASGAGWGVKCSVEEDGNNTVSELWAFMAD